jgi:hypothetical protein
MLVGDTPENFEDVIPEKPELPEWNANGHHTKWPEQGNQQKIGNEVEQPVVNGSESQQFSSQITATAATGCKSCKNQGQLPAIDFPFQL